MRKMRMMIAFGGIALIAFCEPAFSQPMPQAKPKAAQQTASTKNKALAHRAQREANANRLRSTAISAPPKAPLTGWPALVKEARKYMGTNPTARDRLWCATFMNMVLAKVGYSGTNSDAARSFAQYGRRINEPRIGAIAVLTRGKNGGHVGVVSGIDPHGNPIIISGNHGRKVGEAIYPRSRVIAYVMPTDQRAPTQFADRGAPQKGSDSEFDSPIAELLAVIESEYNAKGRPRGTGPEPRPVPPSQARRDVPLDPDLAEFLGLKERAPVAKQRPVMQQEAARPQPLPQQQQVSRMPVVQPPAAPAPRRELRVEQRAPGRVASSGTLVVSR